MPPAPRVSDRRTFAELQPKYQFVSPRAMLAGLWNAPIRADYRPGGPVATHRWLTIRVTGRRHA
jgi:hypothetical protein